MSRNFYKYPFNATVRGYCWCEDMSRTSPSIFALALLISGLALASAPFCWAQSGGNQLSVQTTASVEIQPSSGVIGQTVQIKLVITPLPPGSSERFEGAVLKIYRPDGTIDTQGPFTFDSADIKQISYTPTQIGTYRLQLEYPGQPLAATTQTTYPMSSLTKLEVNPVPTPAPTPRRLPTTWTKPTAPTR